MSFKLENAEIIKIGELKEFDSGFKLVEFVVKTEGDYPQEIQFQCTSDKADNLIQYNKVGNKVDISFNLRGRAWTNPQGETKYFNSLDAWRVFKAEGGSTTQSADPVVEEDSSGLPF